MPEGDEHTPPSESDAALGPASHAAAAPTSDSADQRYFHWIKPNDEQTRGEITEYELRNRIADGLVKPEDLVWTEGMPDWRRAGSLPELEPLFAARRVEYAGAIPSGEISFRKPWGGPPMPLAIKEPKEYRGYFQVWAVCAAINVLADVVGLFVGIAPGILGPFGSGGPLGGGGGPGIPWGLIIFFSLVGIFQLTAYVTRVVMVAMLVYHSWRIIQDGRAQTTPGKAVGFMFIPLFNLYYAFIAFRGFFVDAERYAQARALGRPKLFAPDTLMVLFPIVFAVSWIAESCIPFAGVVYAVIAFLTLRNMSNWAAHLSSQLISGGTRCASCDYDLAATPDASNCPECGTPVAKRACAECGFDLTGIPHADRCPKCGGDALVRVPVAVPRAAEQRAPVPSAQPEPGAAQNQPADDPDGSNQRTETP